LEVQHPTLQEDQIETNELAILEQQSLQYLQTIDPFFHTVHTKTKTNKIPRLSSTLTALSSII
jgi:hypothetical protein